MGKPAKGQFQKTQNKMVGSVFVHSGRGGKLLRRLDGSADGERFGWSIAMAQDANLPNMEVAETTVTPYLGPFDFLLDILSIRWAKVEGTWGYPPRAQ